MSKFRFAFILGAAIFVLMGCIGGSSPEENIYNILEETFTKEDQYVKVQKPLQELEEKEKEIYTQIMDLSMKEFKKIESLSNDALENIEKRKEYIEKENKSMNEASEEFANIEEYVGKIKNEDLKKEAEVLQKTMKERYELHEKLTSSYLEALTLDKKLYELFKKEDLTIEELEKQITSINKQYEKVESLNKEYNSKTEEFNKYKQDFYSSAGLEVEENQK
ncbi:YkyA family protein [Rossellomorea aquimaris]|uniref:YkyA family protein n=1 Tax=Rossellomorea aquimaris TaxID=189382 RepID=UPI0009ED8CD0|nr:YkyA family protein [Rossellomorea aquimaris]